MLLLFVMPTIEVILYLYDAHPCTYMCRRGAQAEMELGFGDVERPEGVYERRRRLKLTEWSRKHGVPRQY